MQWKTMSESQFSRHSAVNFLLVMRLATRVDQWIIQKLAIIEEKKKEKKRKERKEGSHFRYNPGWNLLNRLRVIFVKRKAHAAYRVAIEENW